MKVSVLILTCDREKNLHRAIASVQCVVDEIVVLDFGPHFISTRDIVGQELKIRVFYGAWENDFSKARNQAIGLASNDICFFIDADEFLHEDSKKVFKEVINNAFSNDAKSVYAPVIDNLNGTKLKNNGRAFLRRSTLKYYGLVHEYLFEPGLKLKELDMLTLNHDGYNDVDDNVSKNYRNLILLEKQILKDPSNFRWHFFMLRYLSDSDERKIKILKDFADLPLPYDSSLEVYALNAKCSFITHLLNICDFKNAALHAEELNKYYSDKICTQLLFLSKYMDLKKYYVNALNEISTLHDSLFDKEVDCYILGEVNAQVFESIRNEFISDINLVGFNHSIKRRAVCFERKH